MLLQNVTCGWCQWLTFIKVLTIAYHDFYGLEEPTEFQECDLH